MAAHAGPAVRPGPARYRLRPRQRTERTPTLRRYRGDGLFKRRARRRPLELEELSARTLAQVIDERRIATAEELIEILPAELRSNVLLFPFSRSAQRGSLEEPRVVLFSPDAQLLIGIGRNASHSAANSVEVIELNEVTGRWKFSQLSLAGKKSRGEKCGKCHRGRPIWDSGGRWPEAYGQQWMDSTRETDYRNLAHRGRGIFGRLRLPYSGHDVMGQNRRFTLLIQHADAHRIGSQLAELPDEPRYRAALTAAFADLELSDIAGALPGRPGAAHLEREYRRLLTDTRARIREYVENKDARAAATGLPSGHIDGELEGELRGAARVAKLRLVLGRMGHAELMDDWALTRATPDQFVGGERGFVRSEVPLAAGNYGFARSDPHQREGDALDAAAYRYLERVGAPVGQLFHQPQATSGLGYEVDLVQIDPDKVRAYLGGARAPATNATGAE